MKTKPLSMNELKDAFYSLKSNKSPFNLSNEKGVFPDDLKIARVTPIYKVEDSSDVSNYRPMSVLPCYSKILECIIYNRLYKYLIENDMWYSKQFGFHSGYSIDHSVVQLVDQITESFENDKYILDVFIDLSKAFNTVDHPILLKKIRTIWYNE